MGPKPWGNISDPIHYDHTRDAVLDTFEQPESFSKGVWHISHIPYIDHLDLCGLPPYLSKLRVLFGLEYRPQFWTNLFNRLKTLEVDNQLSNTTLKPHHRRYRSHKLKTEEACAGMLHEV
jgi:hypothetical protein